MSDNGPSKPIVLHARTDVNVRIDPNARMASFTCAHPDGLLGAYEVIIQYHQIKRVAAAILQYEGTSEIQQLAKAARESSVRILKPT